MLQSQRAIAQHYINCRKATSMENGKIWLLHRSTKKIEAGDYVRETTPVPNFMRIRPLGASGQTGKI